MKEDIFRRNKRNLTPEEINKINSIHTHAEDLWDNLNLLTDRYGSLSRTALEESIMWAIKSITK